MPEPSLRTLRAVFEYEDKVRQLNRKNKSCPVYFGMRCGRMARQGNPPPDNSGSGRCPTGRAACAVSFFGPEDGR